MIGFDDFSEVIVGDATGGATLADGLTAGATALRAALRAVAQGTGVALALAAATATAAGCASSTPKVYDPDPDGGRRAVVPAPAARAERDGDPLARHQEAGGGGGEGGDQPLSRRAVEESRREAAPPAPGSEALEALRRVYGARLLEIEAAAARGGAVAGSREEADTLAEARDVRRVYAGELGRLAARAADPDLADHARVMRATLEADLEQYADVEESLAPFLAGRADSRWRADALTLLAECRFQRTGHAQGRVECLLILAEAEGRTRAGLAAREQAAFAWVDVGDLDQAERAHAAYRDELRPVDPPAAAATEAAFGAMLHENRGWLGRPLPPFSARGVSGEEVSPETCAGRVTIVDFWKPFLDAGADVNNPPRLASLDRHLADLRRAAREIGERDLAVVTVSMDEDDDRARREAVRANLPWPVVIHEDGPANPVAAAFGVRAAPRLFLADRSGVVRYVQLRGPAIARRAREIATG